MAEKKKTRKTTASSSGKSTAKTRKKKATVKTTINASKEKPLTKKEVENFRQVLLKKRVELLGDVNHMSEEALDSSRQNSAGELSNMPIHMADVGTDNYEKEFTIGLIESDRNLLKDIDRALAKIKEGAYGICEGTGVHIGKARLTAKPEARYHIDFARKLEQGLVELPSENGNSDNNDATVKSS